MEVLGMGLATSGSKALSEVQGDIEQEIKRIFFD